MSSCSLFNLYLTIFCIQTLLLQQLIAEDPTALISNECHIENYPYMVSLTKTSTLTVPRQYWSLTGVLLTLQWVITTRDNLEDAEEYKITLVIAGCDQSFYADYVEHYRTATNFYAYKHKKDESNMASVAVAKLDRPFPSTPQIKAVTLPKDEKYSTQCRNVNLVRFSVEQKEHFRLKCHNVSVISHKCFIFEHFRTETRDVYVGRRRNRWLRSYYGSGFHTVTETKKYEMVYPVFCTDLDDGAPILEAKSEGAAVFCQGVLIGITVRNPGDHLSFISKSEQSEEDAAAVKKIPEGRNFHIRIGEFLTFIKLKTSMKVPYESLPTSLDEKEVKDGANWFKGSFWMTLSVSLAWMVLGMM